MLFREGHLKRPLTFHQELSHLKYKKQVPAGSEKSHQNYELTLTVLNLLMAKTPQITD